MCVSASAAHHRELKVFTMENARVTAQTCMSSRSKKCDTHDRDGPVLAVLASWYRNA